jgi:hypothetical protein
MTETEHILVYAPVMCLQRSRCQIPAIVTAYQSMIMPQFIHEGSCA